MFGTLDMLCKWYVICLRAGSPSPSGCLWFLVSLSGFWHSEKAIFSRLKISITSWIIQPSTLLLVAPRAPPATKFQVSLSHIPIFTQPSALLCIPPPHTQSSRLVPRHLSEFALYLNFKSHSHLQDGELQRQSDEAGCFHTNTKQLKSFLWDESRI